MTARPPALGIAMVASKELASRERWDMVAGSFRCKIVRQSKEFLSGQILVGDDSYRVSDGVFSLHFEVTGGGLLRHAFIRGEGRDSTEGLQ
jgi:hypothetical protein